MPFWTKPTPSGCPFPQIDASLGGAAEVNKKPNFIEFYEISRSLHSDGVWRERRLTPLKGGQTEKESYRDKSRNTRLVRDNLVYVTVNVLSCPGFPRFGRDDNSSWEPQCGAQEELSSRPKRSVVGGTCCFFFVFPQPVIDGDYDGVALIFHSAHKSLSIEQYNQAHFGRRDFAWHMDSGPASLQDVLPARSGPVDGKVLAFHFGRHLSRRGGQVAQPQAGQSALDQLHHKP